MFKMWIEIVLFLLLAACAVCDGMKKEIPLAVVWGGILLAAVLRIRGDLGAGTWTEVLLSMLPGAAFWLLGLITGEKVGYGDGWILIMIGLFTGLRRCFLILLVGLMVESAVVLVLLAVRKIGTDTEVPFAPFLLAGMGVVLWL